MEPEKKTEIAVPNLTECSYTDKISIDKATTGDGVSIVDC